MAEQKLPEFVALRAREFFANSPIARNTEYTLPQEQRPRSIRVGGTRVFLETPSDWLKRIAAAQEERK